MARAIQRRRGTTAQHTTFSGLAGEITVDTDKKVAVVHDGSTAGGFPLARNDKMLGLDALTDPNADRVPFWDDSAGALAWLTLLGGFAINGTNLRKMEAIGVAVSDESTVLTTGTAKLTFRMPYAFTLTEVRANLNTVSSSGTPTIDVKESGTTIFSTVLTIDATEKTSVTAAAPAVISDANLADDAEMTVDINTAGTGAKGLKLWLIGYRP